MNTTLKSSLFLLLLVASNVIHAQKNKKPVAEVAAPGKVWTAEKANAWYATHKWLTGANYIPANAINQLEMWQAEAFDTANIQKQTREGRTIRFNKIRGVL